MSFVFLSYSREDTAIARRLVGLLKQRGFEVFWDRDIRFGDDHKKVIVDRLESAACVLVLWSTHSCASHWVNYEAQTGLDRGTLVEACLDSSKAPPPFGVLNTADLAAWRGSQSNPVVRRLLETIKSRMGPRKVREGDFSLAAPLKTQAVTDSHLALLHTCWRTPEHDARYGFGELDTYRWDIALFGTKTALDRVAAVTYFLHPAYEIPGTSRAIVTLRGASARKTCFRLRQIANGHALVRADVQIKEQTEMVCLSRFINLFDSPANIKHYTGRHF